MNQDDLCLLLRGLTPVEWLARREAFYARAFGPLRQPAVYHFEDDGHPHIDVYVIAPTPARPHLTLVTGGMADRAQPVRPSIPPRIEILTYTEAGEADLSRLAIILRELASLPFLHGVHLAPGVLVRGSRPILSGSTLSHAALTADVTPAEPFLVDGGEEVRFLLVEFVAESELAHGVAHGGDRLAALLREKDVSPVLRPARPAVV